jgi:hypothetical protein
MFKWDRLIRRNKSPKDIAYLNDEGGKSGLDLDSWEDKEEALSDKEEEFEIVEIEILPNKIICPDCGGITLEGLEFCDKCGGEI